MRLARPETCPVQEKFIRTCRELSAALIERDAEGGDGVLRPVPLKVFVAASNEWPDAQEGGRELGALFDRFLLRRAVRPIASAAGRQRLLWDRDHTPRLSTSVTPAEVDRAHADA